MKLYHSQYTRSGRPRWAIEELGALRKYPDLIQRAAT